MRHRPARPACDRWPLPSPVLAVIPRLRTSLTVVALLLVAACKAINDAPGSGHKITRIRFAASERMPCMPCDMIVSADDTAEFHVRETTGVARLAPDSTWVVFTAFGGAGGYRGSGQALFRYDIKTAQKTEIMREYYLIEQIELYPVAGSGPWLIISMREPMNLVRHLAVVDPMRGEIFRSERSVVQAMDSLGIVVREWGPPASWAQVALDDSTGLPKAPPVRTYRVPLGQLKQYAVLSNPERIWGQTLEFQTTTDTFDVLGQDPNMIIDRQRKAFVPQQLPEQNRQGVPGGPGSMGNLGGSAGKKAPPPVAGQGIKIRIP